MKELGTQHLGKKETRSEESRASAPEASQQVPTPLSAGELGTRHIAPRLEAMQAEGVPAQSRPHDGSEGRLPDGHMLQGRYRVLGVLGFGGMSAVYKV